LEVLGSKVTAYEDCVEIESKGWGDVREISVDCEKSTQFASAVMLSAFNLENNLKINLMNFDKSITYLDMTKTILIGAGMKITDTETGIVIENNSTVDKLPTAEPDMSSAFSIASMGVVGPTRNLRSLPVNSIQGDSVFIEILEKMNVKFERTNINEGVYDLIVHPSVDQLRPINEDLSQCPDLLPVLSSLCALCPGTSMITGIGHTRYKESDRIDKSEELVKKAGAQAESTKDTLKITGPLADHTEFEFDPDNDHRMAMAAAVLKAHGVNIKVLTPDVVKKSYPNFWEDAKVNP